MLAPESFWPRDKKRRGEGHTPAEKLQAEYSAQMDELGPESDAAATPSDWHKVKIKSGENKGNFADGHVLMEGLLR
jgi:hypothetical protein